MDVVFYFLVNIYISLWPRDRMGNKTRRMHMVVFKYWTESTHKRLASSHFQFSCFCNINKANFLLTLFTQGYLLEPWCLESEWEIILALCAKDQMIFVFWFLYSTHWHPDKQIELQFKQSLMHHREDIRRTYRVLLMWSIQSIRPWT